MEHIKKQHYTQLWSHNYFWRTYDQKEIDWIEQRKGNLFAYEFKWEKTAPCPKLWQDTYPASSFKCITRENYLDFIN